MYQLPSSTYVRLAMASTVFSPSLSLSQSHATSRNSLTRCIIIVDIVVITISMSVNS